MRVTSIDRKRNEKMNRGDPMEFEQWHHLNYGRDKENEPFYDRHNEK